MVVGCYVGKILQDIYVALTANLYICLYTVDFLTLSVTVCTFVAVRGDLPKGLRLKELYRWIGIGKALPASVWTLSCMQRS